jgi:antirestriction protein ArdC
LPEREIVPQAEALASATLADIRIGGAQAFYCPSDDTVHIPPQPAFFEQINYYRTLFHELGHYAEPRIMPRPSTFLRGVTRVSVACRHNLPAAQRF